jgi:hypothetical protein
VVEFEDGSEGRYSANIISQNMISRIGPMVTKNHCLGNWLTIGRKLMLYLKIRLISRLAGRKSFREQRKAGTCVLSGLMAERLGYL